MASQPNKPGKPKNRLEDAYAEWENKSDNDAEVRFKNYLLRGLIVLALLAPVFLVWVFYKNSKGIPYVTLMNRSGQDLTNIVLSGDGWTHRVPDFTTVQYLVFPLNIPKESPVNLSFATVIRRVEKNNLVQLKDHAGDCLKILVTTELTVEIEGPERCFRSERVFGS